MATSNPLPGGPNIIATPIVDAKTGMMNPVWLRWFSVAIPLIEKALQVFGVFEGTIGTAAIVEGRPGTLADAVQHLGTAGTFPADQLTGVVAATQLPSALPAVQGAVVLPAGAPSNTLGSAAFKNTTDFDPAGAAASAQAAAESHADAVANTAQTNAENFAADASNVSIGTLDGARLPVTYGTGAPSGSATENAVYFDTTGSPYHGYVFHGTAWHIFS